MLQELDSGAGSLGGVKIAAVCGWKTRFEGCDRGFS